MTKLIELTKGKTTIVDDEDYEWLSNWSWCVSSNGYAVRGTETNKRTKLILMHREILEAPEGYDNGKSKWIGYFTTEIEAAKAYDDVAKEYFGDFARLNFN